MNSSKSPAATAWMGASGNLASRVDGVSLVALRLKFRCTVTTSFNSEAETAREMKGFGTHRYSECTQAARSQYSLTPYLVRAELRLLGIESIDGAVEKHQHQQRESCGHATCALAPSGSYRSAPRMKLTAACRNRSSRVSNDLR